MKIVIWHNIMWSRYKGAVFSALQRICDEHRAQLQVIQIAETANERAVLSPIDLSWHTYSYELLFKGAYETIPRLSLYMNVAKRAWRDDSDITILAGYDRPEYWIQAALLRLRGKTFACFCDSTIYDRKQKFLVGALKRLFFHWCSGIFCYGKRAAEYVKLYGASSDKIIHRCQAAALYEGYSPELALQRRVQEYDSSKPPRFLYVGRFSLEKSIDHLIIAFARVRRNYPSATLVLVGGGSEEARLRKLCSRLSVDESVQFAGSKFEDELFSEYLKSTALVLPSHSEPWGLVANEALSHGCPIVVSDRCGCVPELVEDGRTGHAFEWGDVEDLANKMEAVVHLSDVERTANECLTRIGPFTPAAAAQSIFDGSLVLTQRAQP